MNQPHKPQPPVTSIIRMLLDGSQVICKASFQAHAHTTLVSTHVHPPKPREPPGALTVGITIQNQKFSVESVAPSHTLARSVLRTTVWTGLLSHPVHSEVNEKRTLLGPPPKQGAAAKQVRRPPLATSFATSGMDILECNWPAGCGNPPTGNRPGRYSARQPSRVQPGHRGLEGGTRELRA
jgi:hypothetical protein